MMRIIFLCVVVALTTAMSNCDSETLFKSNFDTTPISQPPAASQAVGTVAVQGDIVVASLPDSPSVKGVRIRPYGPGNWAELNCNLKEEPTAGTYVFSASVYIPSQTAGMLTISFDRAPGTVSPGTAAKGTLGGDRFLHLDFLGDDVTIDNDPATTFGKFPRDQLFVVQVTLKLDSSPSAHIVLSGAGASGEATRNIQQGTLPIALSFGKVKIWTVQSADEQTFYMANILVKRKP